MRAKLQWTIRVHFDAPVAKVWEDMEDLSLIPQYHPHVGHVEYLSGTTKRAPGVEYKCVVPKGRMKGWCIEKVVENIPFKKMSVAFPADSWGLSKMFGDFLSEVVLEPDADATLVELRTFYTPIGFKAQIMNLLFLPWFMRRRARQTLVGFKHLVESQR